MSFSVPQLVVDFFLEFPNASPVHVLEGGNAFLGHFEGEAQKESVQMQEKLYTVNSDGTYYLKHPQRFNYSIVYDTGANGGISLVDIDDKFDASVLTQDAQGLQNAFDSLLSKAGFTPTVVDVVQVGPFDKPVFSIELTLPNDVQIKLLDDNDVGYPFTQSF